MKNKKIAVINITKTMEPPKRLAAAHIPAFPQKNREPFT
jgi:hypothetical protein